MDLSLSDGLVELSRLLADFEHEPKVLDPEDARTLRQILRTLRLKARALENEVSRDRWDRAARRDREAAAIAGGLAVAAHMTAGGNVLAFPNVRPAFDDGRGPREWR
jgi:hypothetical protein